MKYAFIRFYLLCQVKIYADKDRIWKLIQISCFDNQSSSDVSRGITVTDFINMKCAYRGGVI